MLEIERTNKAHLGAWAFATRPKNSKPVPLKSATLADCCVGFLLAKVVYFYWPTDGFSYFKCWQSFICEGGKGRKEHREMFSTVDLISCLLTVLKVTA